MLSLNNNVEILNLDKVEPKKYNIHFEGIDYIITEPDVQQMAVFFIDFKLKVAKMNDRDTLKFLCDFLCPAITPKIIKMNRNQLTEITIFLMNIIFGISQEEWKKMKIAEEKADKKKTNM